MTSYPHLPQFAQAKFPKKGNQPPAYEVLICNGRVIFQKERVAYGQPKDQEQS
jgi:hypothetical protein